jgi:hypothetical protein
MTLDLYGHLFPDQLDQLADALDAAHDAAVASPSPNGKVINLAASTGTAYNPRNTEV